MTRILAFFLALFSLAGPALGEPIDQTGWNDRKQSIELKNGITLSYVEMGNPNGSPVLLLHGYTDSSRAWTIAAPYLMEHRLLILDQRGHGGSDKPECCYTVSDFAYDAKLFLDEKGIERAAVVGHSLGSLAGQVMAARYPERVGKLVLIGSTSLVPETRGGWIWTHVMGLKEPVASNTRFLEQWSASASPTPVDPALVAWSDREIAAIPLHVWKSVVEELVDAPAGRFAADIEAPTLILSGGKDVFFPPAHHAALARAIPHAEERVFPALGHNLIVEKPDLVGPAIAAFLE